jgi:hypothetical protein
VEVFDLNLASLGRKVDQNAMRASQGILHGPHQGIKQIVSTSGTNFKIEDMWSGTEVIGTKVEVDFAMAGFKPYDAIKEAYTEDENIFHKGWWVAFDMDKVGGIESSLRGTAVAFLNKIILEKLNFQGAKFFSTGRTMNYYQREEGFIYIPSDISKDELSGRLKAVRDAIQDETRQTIRSKETVTFAALKGDDLAAYQAGHVVEGVSPQKDITVMENLLSQLLREGKGTKRDLRDTNYGNKSVFYNPTGGIDFTASKTPLEIQNAGVGIKFYLDPAMLEQLRNAPGFVPVIISVKPMVNLQGFLGIVNQR